MFMQLSSLFLLLTGATAFATDIMWLKLTPNFSYRDFSIVCSTQPFMGRLYLGAEVEGIKVTKAVIKTYPSDLLAQKIILSSTEANAIELYIDQEGRFWLKQLPLNSRLLNWVFFHASDDLGKCRPPQPLSSIDPLQLSFAFSTEGLGESTSSSQSQVGKFKGQLKDSSAYQAQLSFTEEQYSTHVE